MSTHTIERLSERAAKAAIPRLSEILVDCVEGGASVSFLAPLSLARAGGFWQNVVVGVGRGERLLLVARDEAGSIDGTVQIVTSLPENQPHRADISKLLVHRSARRCGLGELLMRAAERAALAEGKALLVLDTASNDAKRLYDRLGWTVSGVIPNYALNPDRSYCDTTVYWKALAPLV